MVNGKAFKVPKALLCYNSKYFETALGDGIDDALDEQDEGVKKEKIELEMATEEVFELVLQWSEQS